MKTAYAQQAVSNDQLQSVPTSSASRILQELEWLEDLQFMAQECAFLNWLLAESIDSTIGEKKQRLQGLLTEFQDFQIAQIESCILDIQQHLDRKKGPRRRKRSMANNLIDLDWYRNLQTRMQTSKVEFRRLKRLSFTHIDRFMNFRIV
ncbi:MAG: hypothetical protein AAF598_02225 [Bacteroidota bacterium]